MALASTPHPVMSHIHPKFMGYTAIIIIQIFIMALGYVFLGAVAYYEYYTPSNPVCELMRNYTGEVTMLVILIATVLSITTTMSVYLLLFATNIGMLRLLTAGWTTLLTPVYLMWPVQLNGSEIDITGSAFATLLHEEFLVNGLTFVQDNAFEILDIGGMLSGVVAAGFTFSLPGHSILMRGSCLPLRHFLAQMEIRMLMVLSLGFSGGNITVNTGVIPRSYSRAPIPQGFSMNYLMWQQGLTANVSCQAIDSSQMQYLWNTNNSDVIYINPAALSNNPITGLRLWNISANCGTTYEYVTLVDANGSGNLPGNGFLPSVVCPGSTNMNQTYTSFTIFTQGFYKYNFLKASSENVELLSFIAGVARYQSINLQGLTSSMIRDTLYSIYSSTTNKSVNNNLNDTQVYLELEGYWRGVVEFSTMFLRSRFMAIGSFPDNIILNNLSSPVNGMMFISTIGWTRWTRKLPTYLLATIPLTIITILTFACTFYSILQYHQEHQDKQHYRANFDVSNILHLIIACAGEKLILSNISDKIKRIGGDVHPRDLKSTDLRTQEVHVENNHV
ncbi:hypothetical protein EV424DRAFT_1565379 [Suillus variegatus]|nr:hypothetical protein EV424DRAFT_1565379 [Suillus variegatus]